MTAWVVTALAALPVALVAVAATADPARGATLDRHEWLARWSAGHGGYDPHSSRAASGWLRLVLACARPLARRGVAPDALTLLGVVVGGEAVVSAHVGGRWWVCAAALVVLCGLVDGLDGAVALLSGRSTPFGAVLDSLADRVGEAAFAAGLWLAGAAAWACVTLVAATWLLEEARARAAVAGMHGIGVVTVWERPSRVIATALTLLVAGVSVRHHTAVAGVGASASLALSAVGLGHVVVVVRRDLRSTQG